MLVVDAELILQGSLSLSLCPYPSSSTICPEIKREQAQNRPLFPDPNERAHIFLGVADLIASIFRYPGTSGFPAGALTGRSFRTVHSVWWFVSTIHCTIHRTI